MNKQTEGLILIKERTVIFMKKKIICALLCASLASVSALGAFAEENIIPERVEIQFNVGDSVLSINGKNVEVQTPYVVNGTTLVPLRVITEAFGATVKWNGGEQSITLDYPDVNVVLHIGSKTAGVNDHTEELLEAPVVLGEGHTMVPLRFISETFGATVGWDQETSRVTVIKESPSSEPGKTVTNKTEYPKTGDSYYKWSINTPKNLDMKDRAFDGTYTVFADANDNYLDIDISDLDENQTIDDVFNIYKSEFSGYTFVQSDKTSDSFTIQVRNTMGTIYVRAFIRDNKVYSVMAGIKGSDEKVKGELIPLADSFSYGFSGAGDTYDLSDINKDGYRTKTDDKYRISFDVPADWTEIKGDAENEFMFSDPDNEYSSVHLSIYSRTDAFNAYAVSIKDRAVSQKIYNPDCVSFSDIHDTTVAGAGGYFYIRTFRMEDKTFENKDIFFDLGEYVYNISVSTDGNGSAVSEHIINSISARELDSSEVGSLLRMDTDYSGSTTEECNGFNFKIPSSWLKVSKMITPPAVGFIQKDTGATLSVSSAAAASNQTSADAANSCIDYMKNNMNAKVYRYVKTENLNGTSFCTFVLSIERNGKTAYNTHYITIKNSKMFDISLMEGLETFGGLSLDEIKSIAGSISLAK